MSTALIGVIGTLSAFAFLIGLFCGVGVMCLCQMAKEDKEGRAGE